MNIFNRKLVHTDKKYPFDSVSKEYDLFSLIIKAIICIEFNVWKNTLLLDYLVYFLNICIYALGVLIFGRIVILVYGVNFDMRLLYANINKNRLRKYIILYNAFFTTLILIGYDNTSSLLIIYIWAIFSLILVLMLFICEMFYFDFYYKHHNELTYDLVLLMLIVSDQEDISKERIKALQYSIFIGHFKTCKGKQCNLCTHYSNDIDKNTELYFNTLLENKTHKVLKKESMSHANNNSKCQELIKVFYYKIKGDNLHFLMLSYDLIKKYQFKDNDYSNQLKLILNYWLSKETIIQVKFIDNIFELSDLEKNLNVTLNYFETLINDNVQVSIHKTVFELAKQLRYTVEKLKLFILKHELKDDSYALDNTIKLTNSVFKYNLTLMRYISEALLNQELSNLPPLNIDQLDEGLNSHYFNDNILILSVDLCTSNKEIKIIKATGELGHDNPQYFNEYFSSKFQEKAVDLFLSQVKKSKASTTTGEYHSDTNFISIAIKSKGILHYMKYSFYLSESIKNNNIIIYGFYIKEPKNCIIIDNRLNQYERIIIDGCKEFYQMLYFKPSWLALIKSCDISFSMETLFKTIDEEKDHIQCEFDYNYYMNFMSKTIRKLNMNDNFKGSEKMLSEVKTSIKKLHKLKGKSIILILEKLAELDDGKYKLYHINSQTVINTQSFADIYDKEDNDIKNFFHYNSQTFSNSSLTKENSVASNTVSKKKNGSEFQVSNIELKKKIKKDTRHLSMFSWVMIILNGLLILICSIFLITQIFQSNLLSEANQFFFKYKTLRILVANFLMSVAGPICFASSPNDPFCVNDYRTYSKYFQQTYGMEEQYDFVEFLITEVKYKANYAQEVLGGIKEAFYMSGNAEYISLLTDQMSYFIFEKSSDEIQLVKSQVSFEEGMRQYINSIFIICNSNVDPTEIPLYYISYNDGMYEFDNVVNKTLITIQKELYKELMNYVNFSVSFNKGEAILQNSFNRLKNQNNVLTSVFMVCIALLNVLLLILCIGNIKTAYSLFKVLILNVINEFEDENFKPYFKTKMKSLSRLSTFYTKNPNKLIRKVIEGREKFMIVKYEHEHRQKTYEENERQEQLNKIKENHTIIHFGNQFYFSITSVYLIVLIIIFGIYFIIIITFDIVLSKRFTKLFEIYEYVYLQYNHENSLFAYMAFTHLTVILNITDVDFAKILNKPNPEDGVMNFLVRDGFDKYYKLLAYKSRQDPISFPSLQDHLDYDCAIIFNKVQDRYFKWVKEEIGKDYELISSLICKSFDTLNLDGFSYMILDLELRTQELINIRDKNDYASIAEYARKKELYEGYTILLLFYRPICTYFRNQFLLPTLTKGFDDYVVFVGVYLCVNILLEIVIFAVIKFYILNNLEALQNNLYLLNNCVN